MSLGSSDPRRQPHRFKPKRRGKQYKSIVSLRMATPLTSHRSQVTNHAAVSDAQSEFFHATNASAVEGVVEAIECAGGSGSYQKNTKSARARVVREIYGESSIPICARIANLRRKCAMRFGLARSTRNISARYVSLITSRARQALPAVAKRVLNEWTSALVNANQERRTRSKPRNGASIYAQVRAARGMTATDQCGRTMDYSRLSDADILNL